MNPYFLSVLFFAGWLTGCGYSVPYSQIELIQTTNAGVSQTIQRISGYLGQQGFKSHGVDEGMIQLLRGEWPHEDEQAKDFRKRQIELHLRLLHFSNDGENLSVDVIDYSDSSPRAFEFSARSCSAPCIEVTIHNHRPGGFSKSARNFHDEMMTFLNAGNGWIVREAVTPPPEDRSKYILVSAMNWVAGGIIWLIVFLLPLSAIGLLSGLIPTVSRHSHIVRRTIFVLLGAFLATPLPFPAASILMIPLPSIFMWIDPDPDYLFSIRDVAMVSLSASACVGTLVSFLVFRKPRTIPDSR